MTRERLLAIETSSAQLSLAVGNSEKALHYFRSPLAWRHAEALLKALRQLLKQQRWRVQSLNGIIVSTGPGSFTGIRIGLAAARALGQTLAIPVVGVSSLETIAYQIVIPEVLIGDPVAFSKPLGPRLHNSGATTLICPAIDALRGDVFTALFEQTAQGTFRRVWADQRLSADVLEAKLKQLRKKGVVVRRIQHTLPDARALLALGAPRLAGSGPHSYREVLPTYLRQAAAQERRSLAV